MHGEIGILGMQAIAGTAKAHGRQTVRRWVQVVQ